MTLPRRAHVARRPMLFAPTATAALAILLTGGCDGPSSGEPVCLEPTDVQASLFAPDLIAAVAVDDGVRIRGLSGAIAPQVDISANGEVIAVDNVQGFDQLISDAETVELVATAGDGEEQVTYRVRRAEDALACSAAPALETGTLPNAITTIASCDGEGRAALVPLSGDGSLDVVDLAAGERPANTPYFPPLDGQLATGPWDVDAAPEGDVAAVSLRGVATVALVVPCTGEVLSLGLPQTPEGSWLVVPVEPTVALREPRDVDGDGIDDTEVRRMRASGPQAVVFSGGRVWVTWTNVLEEALDVDHPMTAGVGLVSAYDLDETRTALEPAGQAILPFQNAQGLVADGEDGVWVSATGTYARDANGGLAPGSDGGLAHIDAGFRLTRRIDAGAFSPASPALVGDRLIVGSTLRGEVAVLPVSAESFDDAVILSLTDADADNDDTVFEAHALPGGLVALTHFKADALRVLDPATATLDPFPFVGPLPLVRSAARSADQGPGSLLAPPEEAPATPIFRGAQAVSFDRWRGAALLGLSFEIVPLDLRQVMGP